MKRLSIIIVTYHSEKDIFDCIHSIIKFSDLPLSEIEIIVVDNNSSNVNETFTALRQEFDNGIILLKNSLNGGYGQGNNVGLRHASAPVCLIMNPDVRLVEPIFMTAVDAFELNPDICLYGMKQKVSDNRNSNSSISCTRMMNGYLYTILDGICNRFDLYLSKWMYLQGSCFFLNKKKFEEIGLFDEEMFMYGEEDDITYRLRQRFGSQFIYNPKLSYLHLVAERPISLDRELKIFEAVAKSNEKKGYPRYLTVRNKLRNIRLRLWRENLKRLFGKKNDTLYNMLLQFKKELKKRVFFIDPASMLNLSKYDYYLLSENTMSVDYYCSRYYDFETNPRIHYHKLFAYFKLPGNLLKAINYIWGYLVILFNMLRRHPQVVHIQWLRIPKFDYIIIRLMRRLLGAKVVFTAHNIIPHDSGTKYLRVFTSIYREVDSIIVHSQDSKSKLHTEFSVPSEKIEVIMHGILPILVDENEYNIMESTLDERFQFKDKMVFVALGFQDYYKGTDLLARAWAEAPELSKNNELQLVIMGKFKSKELDLSPLEGLSNVIVDDRRITEIEFLYLLRHAAAYVLPYRVISQSGALLTAITEHVPVVVTDIGALAEPLSVAPIGWKISSPEVEELKHTLIWLSAHPEEIAKKKNDSLAWQTICQHYDWKTISRQTQNLYEKLICTP